MKNVDKYHLS